MNNQRRQFIRDMSLTATALTVASQVSSGKTKPDNKVVSCAPEKVFEVSGTITSVKSGNWSDASVWGGKVPGSADTPVISSGHTIVFDMATTTVAGLNISAGGTLSFNPVATVTLQTNKNVVVLGKLVMKPTSAANNHTLRFINVNENNFVGGGMDVLASDVGLWVMGAGALDLLGASKTSWTNATGAISQGATTVNVKSSSNWRVGDAICIAPTEAPGVGAAYSTAFEETTIKSVSGTSVTLNKATSRPHPQVNNLWTAEVMNLSRNVNIEGTSTGSAHIFVRSTSKQSVRFVGMRYLGPRKDKNGDGTKELVPGRYGIHFHHCMEASRGSLVEGCIMREINNHSYVPHVSHGITFLNNIAYNVVETAFWWDPGDPTHEIIYDRNIVAICRYIPRSLNMNAEDAPTFSSSGFALNTGDGNVCSNNVVVAGGMGDVADGGAYNWEAVVNEGVWIFNNNVAHNNDCGLRVWQNSTRNHVIEDYVSYHNKMGMFHGAYANSYTYTGGHFYGCGMQLKAASVNSNKVRIENIIMNGAGMCDYGIEVIHSPLPGEKPVFVRNVTIRGYNKAAVLDSAGPEVHSTDLVQCMIEGAITVSSDAASGETIRVQPKSGTPYKITKSGKSNIATFAPIVWGTGKGLKAEYFNSNNFTKAAYTRVDSNVSFSEWSTGVHYKITGSLYSIRWTGKIQPQYTESYTFNLSSGGGHRLWVNGKLLLDAWAEKYPGSFATAPIALEAGKLYDIKLEYFNNDAKTGMGLFWSSKSQPMEYVPQSQLYADAISEPNPDPTDAPPLANAGPDQTLTLPNNSTTLNGLASKDPEGTRLTYQWVKLSGPSKGGVVSPTNATTKIRNLVQGTYVFQLTVKDAGGASATDTVSVVVRSGTASNSVVAANDIVITAPANSVTLNGTPLTGIAGSQLQHSWMMIDGPQGSAIQTPHALTTEVTGLVPGTYIFKLETNGPESLVQDEEMRVIVKPELQDGMALLNIEAFPNPSTSYFNIKTTTSNRNTPVTISVVNAKGNTIERVTTLNNGSVYRIGAMWKPGVYFVVSQQGKIRRTVTLIKQ